MENMILKKLEQHDGQFNLITKKLDEHDGQFDLITRKVLDHEERLIRIEENMATKDDIRGLSGTMDQMLKLMLKKDQELVMMSYAIQRNERDIATIKPLVGLA